MFLDLLNAAKNLYPGFHDYEHHAVALVMENSLCPHPVCYRYVTDYDGKLKPIMETCTAQLLHKERRIKDVERLTWKCAVCGWEYYDGKEWEEIDPTKMLLARCLANMLGVSDD